jgi:hypothetical protein
MSTASATTTKHTSQYTCDKKPPSKTQAAIEFAQQAERLGQYAPHQESDATGSTQAIEAKFITAQDPVITTANGGRLPAVPIEEATRLNRLRNVVESRTSFQDEPVGPKTRIAKDGTVHGLLSKEDERKGEGKTDAPLGDVKAPWSKLIWMNSLSDPTDLTSQRRNQSSIPTVAPIRPADFDEQSALLGFSHFIGYPVFFVPASYHPRRRIYLNTWLGSDTMAKDHTAEPRRATAILSRGR